MRRGSADIAIGVTAAATGATYVGITPDYVVRVSEELRADYQNGRRYYPYDGQRLANLPANPANRPSRDALAWHFEHVFSKAG